MNPILKRVLTGITLGGIIIAATLYASVTVVACVCSALAVLAVWELAMLLRRKFATETAKACGSFVFFAILIATLFTVLPVIAARGGNLSLLFVLALVKFSDVGGFAFGCTTAKLMKKGNHKLCPSISPGKSWEGLLGSFVFSSLAASAFILLAEPLAAFGRIPPALAEHGVVAALGFGLFAALVGTAGDLVESKLKRWVGVKDSSTMKCTNGLGGFLDMFDSLLFVPAILWPWL